MDALQVDLLRVERTIRMIRHDKVILDDDLARVLRGLASKLSSWGVRECPDGGWRETPASREQKRRRFILSH